MTHHTHQSQDTFRLGHLALAAHHRAPINIDGHDPGVLIPKLRHLYLIRKAEQHIASLVGDQTVACPCHLSVGQEAVAVGVAHALRATDRAFSTHRGHAHYLAMGCDLYQLFAEVQGRYEGCSRGMGGSQHLYGADKGFIGSVPIVAGTIALAVGAALAAKMDAKKSLDVGVCFFGDGACEEGALHESLNLAANYQLPALFVCENNLFASHLHVSLRQPKDSMARFAEAAAIKHLTVDGNDLTAVMQASQELTEHCRSGRGPAFLEAVTYRWLGHVGHRDDMDVGVRRKEDLGEWKQRDPINRLFISLQAKGHLSESEWNSIKTEVDRQVEETWNKSTKSPYPNAETLMSCVYADKGGRR
jgi:TPP-dependent pyruvate/acetoin dehydrogenase alpha subunit